MSGQKKREFQFGNLSNDFFDAVLLLQNKDECERFFRDVMTTNELQSITERFAVAKELYTTQKSYRSINAETGVSTATITRVAEWMKNGMGGYNLVLNRLFGSHHHNINA